MKGGKKENKPMTKRSGAGKNVAGLTGQEERLIRVGAVTGGRGAATSHSWKGWKEEEEEGC